MLLMHWSNSIFVLPYEAPNTMPLDIFHSLPVQPLWQANCLPLGMCKGLLVIFEKPWKFPHMTDEPINAL